MYPSTFRQIRSDSLQKIKTTVEILAVTVMTIVLLLIITKSNLFRKYFAYRQSFALAIWIYIPTLVILIRGRNFEDYGITLKRWKKSLQEVGILSLIVLPPYVIAFYMIESYFNSATFRLTISDEFLARTVFLILFISLPEEYFFRGYLQTELNRVFGKKHRMLGVNFGIGLILSAIIFGLVHALLGGGWPALLTIFSGLLFGWLREKTGGILAPTLFHGLGNVVYLNLLESF
ncbi:MAG: type II CAAX prenyl endopeptidase Rce1 family protein [bacterium]